jgi:hypothetical protein
MKYSHILRLVPKRRWFFVTVAMGVAGCVHFASQPEARQATAAPTAQPLAAEDSSSRAKADTAAAGGCCALGAIDFGDHDGYIQIFDGKSLRNWDGDPAIWHVEDGAIVGESNNERPVVNSYISFHGFEAKDFDLKLEIKVENNGGSGIQYRSRTGQPWTPRYGQVNPNLNWMMTGPQADFWFPVDPDVAEWTGQFYSENTPMGAIARRGQVVESGPGDQRELVGIIDDRTALGGFVRVNDWNQYLIIARGGTFIHVLNGRLMTVVIDDDPNSSNNRTGLIGIEIEGYRLERPTKVSVRNIWIRKLR